MSETKKLKQAREFFASGKKDEAAQLLWKLYESNNQDIRLNAALALLAVLDHFTENNKLLEVAETGIKAASNLGNNGARAYLLGQKGNFLLSHLNLLVYRQKNLMLSANVFKWIEFSLEKNKREYEAILVRRKELEQQIATLEIEVLQLAESSTEHYLRGHVFMSLGELYFSKFLKDQLDLMVGGRKRSRIANIYIVRRWGLEKFIVFNRDARKKMRESVDKCISFFRSAIKEFEAGGNSELAHAFYNLSVKLTLIYRFRMAKKYLKKAKLLAQANKEELLLGQIQELEKNIRNKNKNPRNWVEELGLDMP